MKSTQNATFPHQYFADVIFDLYFFLIFISLLQECIFFFEIRVNFLLVGFLISFLQ